MPSLPRTLAVLLLLAAPVAAADPDAAAFAAAKALGRGVNLGNALEAPLREGQWGVTIKPEYLPKIKAAGFQHVRVPVRWSAHAWPDPDYAINPKFFARVDEVLDQAEKAGLGVVLNLHHFADLYDNPAGETDRCLSLWWQIADRYKNRPDSVVFELLNEPQGKLTSAAWNELLPKVLGVVRKSNPNRVVVIGPGNWNGFRELPKLELPEDDRRIIATFHYYEPFQFTHQGAPWEKDAAKWVGKKWTGTAAEQKQLSDAFEACAKWGKEQRRPLYLGEFGAYSGADMESRATWTAAVRAEAEKNGMPWAYWEFASGFGCYDPAEDRWKTQLLRALVPGEK